MTTLSGNDWLNRKYFSLWRKRRW